MKKIVITLSIIMLAAFSNVLTSCSNDSDAIDNTANAKSAADGVNKQLASGPVVNGNPGNTSHKLIVINNTNIYFYMPFIYAAEGSNGNYKISKKEGTPITVFPMSTITYVDYVTAIPSSYSIPEWNITNLSNPNTTVTMTAANTLATYGLQSPISPIGVKYTYWMGADVFIPGTTLPSNFIGRTSPNSFQVNGKTVSWAVQSSGDCVITVN